MAPSEVVSNPCKLVYIYGAVADPDPTQSYIQPTRDNNTHIVHFTTPFPNRVSSSQALITKIELSQPHTDDCAFCAGLRGNSPAPVASIVNDIIPRKYRSVVKAVLFPCFLLLCAEMLQWGWSIALSFLRSRAAFEADFVAHTIIMETQAEVMFVDGILFAVLAIAYLRAS
jgi:hypothetical protein